MKKYFVLAYLLLFSAIVGYTQSSLKEIIHSSRHYATIVDQGNSYFAKKHPDLSLNQLAFGENRDSEFVKFKRWQSFWEGRLDGQGNLADITTYFRNNENEASYRNNPYQNVAWTNISYEGYITGQIGLGRTTSIGFHPTDANTWYVGAAIGGVWRTTDNGQSYTPLGDDLPFLAVSSIVVDANNPNTIYIAVSDHVWYGPPSIGVYKSTDAGATWQSTALVLDFTDNDRIYWMEADPSDPNTLLVATQGGMYRTTDGFNTVSTVSTINSFHVRFHPSNSNIVYMGVNNGAIYRSTNGGQTFSFVTDLGSGSTYLDVSHQNTDHVYARVNDKLYKSTNSGQNFSQAGTFPENREAFRLAYGNDNIILSGNFEINRSNNGGASFSTITHWLGNNGLPLIHVDQRNIFTNPLQPDFVYFCNDGGVYRYRINTGTFDNLCDGLAITQFYDIAVSQSDPNIVGGGSQDNGNVYRTSSGHWLQYATTGDGMNQDIDPTDPSVRFWSYQNGALRRWENGVNRNIEPPGSDGGAWETPFKLDPSNSNRLIVGYHQIYESMDQGDNWTAISGSLAGGSDMQELAIAPSNGERIYAVRGSRLYVKSTSSNTWTDKSLPNGSISDIEVDFNDMNTLYISAAGYSNGQKVWKSTNAGDSWVNISGSLPNVSTGAIELVDGTSGGIFVGNDIGVYYRDDQSGQWDLYGSLPNTRVEDIEIQYSNEIVRVGTHGRGVLEAPLVVNSPLPVEWTQFNVSAEEKGIAKLDWSLASAENVSHFVVERAHNGSDFLAIDQVAFKSNPIQQYSFTDQNAPKDQAYYRVKTVDFDGTYSYSAVRVVTWGNGDKQLTAYPNPTDGLLTIDVPAGSARVVNWEIINLQGQIMLDGVCSVESDGKGSCNVLVNRLTSGTYILNVQDGYDFHTLKFTKQ